MRYKLTLLAGVASLALAVGSAPALASPCVNNTTYDSPLYGYGTSTGCQYLITVGSGGAITLSAPNSGANHYDGSGSDDVEVGVINNSGSTLTGLHLTGSYIGGFETSSSADGIDTYGGTENAGNPDTTGYGGPITYFANNTVNALDAMFYGGVAGNGGTTYFSLEAPPTAGGGALTVTAVPEPSGFVLLFTGLLGLFAFRKRAATRT